MAIYSYLMVTRAIDPQHLERCRMAQVSGGVTPDPQTVHHGFVYLSLQELATRIAHRATGQMIGDPAGYEVMMRVAADTLVERGMPAGHVQLTMERNMHCGTGRCGHCQLGPAIICRDGPVMRYPDVAGAMHVEER